MACNTGMSQSAAAIPRLAGVAASHWASACICRSSPATPWRDVTPAGSASVRVILCSPPSLPRPVEIAQIGRRLVLPGRHQVSVGAQKIVLAADGDMEVALGADGLAPHWPRSLRAAVGLVHGPRAGQGVVDDRDVVVQEIWVGLVEVDALLDDGLVVLVKRQARAVEGTRTLDVTRFDDENVVAAVAVLVAPLADGVAREGRRDLLRPVASVGENPALVVDMLDQDVRG